MFLDRYDSGKAWAEVQVEHIRLTVFVYSVPVCVAVLGRRTCSGLTVFVYSVPRCVLACQGGGGAAGRTHQVDPPRPPCVEFQVLKPLLVSTP